MVYIKKLIIIITRYCASRRIYFIFFVCLCFCASPSFSTITFAIESKSTPTGHKKKERKAHACRLMILTGECPEVYFQMT